MILSIVLTPTDAALGQAVVTEARVPGRIRQGLNAAARGGGVVGDLVVAAIVIRAGRRGLIADAWRQV